MNSRQYEEVIEYFKEFSPFDDEEEKQADAESAASAIDDILRENADE